MSASLLTALLFAQPAHDHSSLSAPEACVPCSWSLHAPTVLAAPASLPVGTAIVVTMVVPDDATPDARALTTARPRSPPLV